MESLTRYDAMRTALVESHRIDDVKDIRDKAEALRLYAKQAGEGLENQNMMAEIKLRAERRCGELLGEIEREPGKRTDIQPSNTVLQGSGITRMQSSRWQAIAAVPEPIFEQHLAAVKAEAAELTSAGVLRVAKKVKRKNENDKAKEERAARPPAPEAPFVHLYVTEAQHLHMLDDSTVDIIITSPPYNLGDDTWPMGGNGNTTRKGIEYSAHADNMEQCEYERWQIEVFQELYRVAKVGASFFYNHKPRTVSGRIIHPVQWLCNSANPWTVRQEIIWDRKSTHNHSASLFWPIDERIYWMTKGRPEINGESIGMPTIWQEFGPVAGTWHPAPFTLELPRMLLRAIHATPGAVVLDPFAGSCTTLKAALELGCVAVGVDIEREYLMTAAQESGWRHAL